jgi:sugar O-acyltransferase (sialic acid O-acetyltransferase NeuD family)
LEARQTIVIGAGGHGQVVAATAAAVGWDVVGFYDDDATIVGQLVAGIKVMGTLSDLASMSRIPAVLGIGDNEARRRIAGELDLEWISLIHPFAWVTPGVEVGPGSVVLAGSVAQAGAEIGAHAIINSQTGVDHHVHVGDYAHVASAQLGGGSAVGEGAFIGLRSIVFPGVKIGAWATVGAGSMVKTKVRDGATVVGVPAREIVFPGSSPAPREPSGQG